MPAISLLSAAELNELAVKIVRGDVYIVNSEEGLRMSFGHLFMLMSEKPDDEWINSFGAAYEELEKQGPRSVNGYPMFFSMRVLHKDQMVELHEKIEAKRKALEEAG